MEIPQEIFSQFGQALQADFKKYADELHAAANATYETSEDNHARRIKELHVFGEDLAVKYEEYCERITTNLRENEQNQHNRHLAYVKASRMQSIATIYAGGRGMDTAVSIVQQIEELIDSAFE